MHREEVAGLVMAALADQTGLLEGELNLDLVLDEDLGLDSLDAVELLVILESETGLLLDLDEEMTSLRTVGDIVDWLVASATGIGGIPRAVSA